MCVRDLSDLGNEAKPWPSFNIVAFTGVLIIGRTALSGPIPTEIGHLTKLGKSLVTDFFIVLLQISYTSFLLQARLFLSQNLLTGTIPSVIGELGNLVQLNFAQQDLTGTIPSELVLLTNLGKSSVHELCLEQMTRA